MDCVFIGDSIALGVASGMPQCRREAIVGISSGAWLGYFMHKVGAGLTVISLGANDGPAAGTESNLLAIREKVREGKVIWLLPARPQTARDAVAAVAAAHGDRVLDTAPYAGPDGLHPTRQGVKALAAEISR